MVRETLLNVHLVLHATPSATEPGQYCIPKAEMAFVVTQLIAILDALPLSYRQEIATRVNWSSERRL